MQQLKYYLGFFTCVFFLSCGGPELPENVAMEYEKLPKTLDFNQHIKPILSDKCFICHGPDKAKIKAGLQLHVSEKAYAELPDSPGKYAIVPGNLSKSQTVARILTDNPELIMPAPESHLTLSDREKALLVKWIEDGAEYKDHWAFLAPQQQSIPKVVHKDKVDNAIDSFVLAKLEQEGLEPTDRADKETLLRRVSFDLTGLPPTISEIDSFLADETPDAYEKQVDRLLASPHFSEQLALDWMDLSRYADTHGYTVDRYRDVSPWRDWVIKAFNENMPYDQFLRWQIAGDMMPNASKEQILATTFNRLHPQNLEGGIVDEEFRVEYVSDRTNVVSEGMMGLTMACAKCHDHKYDPISQKNYFEMYSFFNNVNESGQIPWDWSMPVPNMQLPTEEQDKFMAYIETLVKEKDKRVTDVEHDILPEANEWIANGEYQKVNINALPENLIGKIDFNNGQINNTVPPYHKGEMKQQFAQNQKAILTEGFTGRAISFDGDTWLDMGKLAIFQRSHPFSIGIRVFIPEELENGVIFHKQNSTQLHSYRGYHVSLKDNKIEVLLAHVWPDNAIVERTLNEMPKNKWVQLTMTYDGSSKADGVKIYLDGEEQKTTIVNDNLYKDIIFNSYTDIIYKNPIEPGLQIGAIWRGKGIGGGKADDILVFDKELSAFEVAQISNPEKLKDIMTRPVDRLTTEERVMLADYFVHTHSGKVKKALHELEEVRKTMVDSMDQVKEIMVMKEMAEPRETFLLERGQYDAYGEQVFPNTPERIFAYPDSLPKNRLGLAQWLTSNKHPLTARVAVNRYWQNIFGTGIVRTTEDFGNQGELPSHPKLLDWLAIHFMESGWDVKALYKLMVMSNTYQQSSKAPEEMLKNDKRNRLLARGPSKRLTGEMLRDNALAASGLLNPKIGGESVKPYQPEGLWKINGAAYEEDKGEKLYRRSMYTIWKRSVPHPTIATFDAPERSFCTVRRQETNTPLQALVLMNDPTYIEASRVLGGSMLSYSDPKEGISTVFRKLTGRKIETEELQLLADLREGEYQKFKENKAKTIGWLDTGEFRISNADDGAMVAANAVVASAIMNSDAAITKR